MSDRSISAVARMTAAAKAFVDALEPDQRAEACAPFDAPDRREWTYLPGPRPGLALADMTGDQRRRAKDLLATGLSARGLATAEAVMELDGILRDIEQRAGKSGWQQRSPELYWFRVLGEPGTKTPWAWKVGGHHLAVHLTVVGDAIAGTPQFFGANPARVPAGHERAGHRTLPEDEDLAREFLNALTPSQREMAITAWMAPRDILTRHDPVAEVSRIPHGLAFHHLHGDHQDLLTRLIRHHLDRALPEVADAAWGEIVAAGLERVTFRWAGSTEAEPGHGHYYAVLGPTFLLEYDNVQNDANHIHTVWRDLRHDWGEDLLAAHYAAHPH
ncbi:MAG TPA: DUF3500 domain-containing protein [Actinopolymorphaceae bacterium]